MCDYIAKLGPSSSSNKAELLLLSVLDSPNRPRPEKYVTALIQPRPKRQSCYRQFLDLKKILPTSSALVIAKLSLSFNTPQNETKSQFWIKSKHHYTKVICFNRFAVATYLIFLKPKYQSNETY